MKEVRLYRMTARAAAAAETADNILAATKQLLADGAAADITLADIAARSGVTVQTILRRFGDKNAVFAAATAHYGAEVRAHRGQAVPNDLDDLLANLVEHYEEYGRLVVKMLGEAAVLPAIRASVEAGRDYHRHWCETVFAATLDALSGIQRARRLAQLVAICDVRTWEMLRVHSGLSRRQTHLALHEMLAPLTAKG